MRCFLFLSIVLFGSIYAEQPLDCPYLVEPAYLSIADWKFEPDQSFPYERVQRGDLIYVEYESLRAFRKVARKIKVPFLVISANRHLA